MSANELSERLRDSASSGLYAVLAADDVAGAARAAGLSAARISLAGVQTKEELLRRFASALGFPEWFGMNWDALEDCLTDMSWRPAEGYLLFIEDIDGLDDLPLEDRRVLFEILRSCARFWVGEATPYFVAFVDPARKLSLPGLLPAGSP